ncbi:MAG: histidine kinase, partial [Bacteroidia bacterium]|nr:histidine kinase [Bacteroidia bacterium]
MKHKLLLAASWLFLLLYHTLRGWEARYTDGGEWQPQDSCSFELRRVLPYFADTELREGDKLLRIDYLPLCGYKDIPPHPAQGRLYLYEVQREKTLHLCFVESKAAFPWGWPRSVWAYRLAEGVALTAFLVGLWFLLLSWGQLSPPKKLWYITGIGSLFSLWLFWAWQKHVSLLEETYLFIGLWGIWLIGGLPLRYKRGIRVAWGGMLLPVAVPPIAGQIFAEALLSLGILYLPWRGAILYGGIWMAWVLMREPMLVGGMGGLLLLSEKRLWQNLRILSPAEVLLPTLSISAGVVAGGFLYAKGPNYALSAGISAALLTWLIGRLLQHIIEQGQYRFKRLQERLPLLWEIVDKAQLQRFILDTLREYADIATIHIQSASQPPTGRVVWLRRSGTPPPPEVQDRVGEADAIFALPRYGWLLIEEGKRPLRAGDVERLEPFVAGVSIALRHLELFEAAHEARLAALRAQLSPHFLFNALNTLQALIYENPTLAEELMAKLGALLRRTLHHARHLKVPLEEEILLVRDYLEIEQQRFGERLKVQWNLPPQLPKVEVPPFTLQLLAENVIKHAVTRLTRPVCLSIHLRETTSHVEVWVEDDGPGIDPTRVEKGIGLSNLLLRLKELYEGRAQLFAERLTPGTRVRIVLPRPLASPDAHTENPVAGP